MGKNSTLCSFPIGNEVGAGRGQQQRTARLRGEQQNSPSLLLQRFLGFETAIGAGFASLAEIFTKPEDLSSVISELGKLQLAIVRDI